MAGLFDVTKFYFDVKHSDPTIITSQPLILLYLPSEQLVIAHLPDAPEGAEIASVDVVIRLRRKAKN